MSERSDTDRVAVMLLNALLRAEKLAELLAAANERIAELELGRDKRRAE